MQLSDVFSQLTSGELSQLSLGGSGTGQIDPTNYSQVIDHINLGLTSIYRRFSLKEGRINLELQPGRTLYTLTSAHAASKVVNGYILDEEGDEFKDDILKVERVYTDKEYELSLNNGADMYSCFTPTMQSLRFTQVVIEQGLSLPKQLLTNTFVVVYRANHPVLATGIEDPSTVEVELPYAYLEPLLLFVASRVHNPIGMSNEFHAGNSYYAKYEAACKLLELHNLQVDQVTESTRLHRNGWV